jgi:hypothetical protein
MFKNNKIKIFKDIISLQNLNLNFKNLEKINSGDRGIQIKG